jgi:MoaA/NifB/PqqE/SkfB family radical SAM enzyme
MLRELFHQVVPPSLYGGETAFPLLSGIRQELRHCGSPAAVTEILERSQSALFARLSRRFSASAAQALALKALNVLLSQYHLDARSVAVSSRPVGLIVDPSNTCQLACPGCVHSARSEALQRFDWRNGTLSEDRFAALLRRFGPYAVGVYFCDYGEPLLNLRTPQLIRAAKQYLLGTALSTSLSVKRFDAEAYVESGLDFMVLSIDGVTHEVYERFRRNGDLDLVLANLRTLVDAKRKLRKRTPALSWNFLAFEHNAHEIPAAARLARRLGVDQFRVVQPFGVTWDDPSIRPASVKPGVRRFNLTSLSNRPENWNPFHDELDAESIGQAFETPWRHPPAADTRRTSGHTCHWLYKNMVMDANGRILPCCGAPAVDRELIFATFEGDSADPFNSPKYLSARSHFATQAETSTYCARCEWDQTTVNIGGPEISRYFRAADPSFFDRRSRLLLSEG